MRGKKTDIETKAKIHEMKINNLSRQEMIDIQISNNWGLLTLCNLKMKEYIKNISSEYMNKSDYNNLSMIKKQSLEMLNELCGENTKQIKPKLRFKILKRDNFTCQYCWRQAPDVILHIDHIVPFSKWWLTKEDNLKTSCQDCNLWKSNIY